MTVRELINELKHYNDDDTVVIKACNSMYVESIDCINIREINSLRRNDYDAVVINGYCQVGM